MMGTSRKGSGRNTTSESAGESGSESEEREGEAINVKIAAKGREIGEIKTEIKPAYGFLCEYDLLQNPRGQRQMSGARGECRCM